MKYSGRDLTIPGQKRALRSLLQSIFCVELLSPSNPLWFSSAWVSDIPILDNSARQFQSLCPDWEVRFIRLSECLEGICSRGGRVVVVIRDEEHNKRFVETISEGRSYRDKRLAIVMDKNQHVKGLVGEHQMIGGSMNFTFSGIEINEEDVIYRTDPSAIHEKRLLLSERWGDILPWSRNA